MIKHNKDKGINSYESEAKELGFDSFRDYLKKHCVKPVEMYYSGWECDETSWIMEDNIITTNHGHFCIFTEEEWDEYCLEMNNYIKLLGSLKEK